MLMSVHEPFCYDHKNCNMAIPITGISQRGVNIPIVEALFWLEPVAFALTPVVAPLGVSVPSSVHFMTVELDSAANIMPRPTSEKSSVNMNCCTWPVPMPCE